MITLVINMYVVGRRPSRDACVTILLVDEDGIEPD